MNMDFKITRALPEDAEALNDIMEQVSAGMNKAEWFISDDLAYIQAHIGHVPVKKGDEGFILKAVACDNEVSDQDTIAGFFMVDFPGVTERNLGLYLDMDEQTLANVAHMDSVVILPEYRGHGLQYRLMEAAEKIIARETDYRTLLATVHPDNVYSLQNALKHGYEVAAEVTKQEIYRRYVMRKRLDT